MLVFLPFSSEIVCFFMKILSFLLFSIFKCSYNLLFSYFCNAYIYLLTHAMKLLIIDNFDSFTYNLKYYAEKFCSQVVVKRNDDISLDEIAYYDGFIISPGPGLPENTGIVKPAIRHFKSTKKILGICLGHQAIAQVFGAKLSNLDFPLHGVAIPTFVNADLDPIFLGIPPKINSGRYHSWVVDKQSLELSPLLITATDKYGQVQALKHQNYNIRSLQFHPESILTDFGLKMIENWVRNC